MRYLTQEGWRNFFDPEKECLNLSSYISREEELIGLIGLIGAAQKLVLECRCMWITFITRRIAWNTSKSIYGIFARYI